MTSFWAAKRVCVTGGAGFLGSALCRRLFDAGARDVFVPRRSGYDLTDARAVARLYDDASPDIVIHLAAEVGGIGANSERPGRFFYANLAMGMHLIEEARKRGVEKFVQVGTVCAYPKHCPVPFREDDLWQGYPEETNAPYGIAKRALATMLQAYQAEYSFNGIFLLPANLYGPADNFDPKTSHVIPAMVRKFCQAVQDGESSVECWGSGEVSREFLYVDDAAEGILAATIALDDPRPVNLGTGQEITIADLASLVAKLTGFNGTVRWDRVYPDGQPRRQLDTSRAKWLLDWRPRIDLEQGLKQTIAWWRESLAPQPKANSLDIPIASC